MATATAAAARHAGGAMDARYLVHAAARRPGLYGAGGGAGGGIGSKGAGQLVGRALGAMGIGTAGPATTAGSSSVAEAPPADLSGMVSNIVKRAAQLAQEVPGMVHVTTARLAVFFLALTALAIVFALVCLCVYLYIRMQPRLPLLTHTADLEPWLDARIAEFRQSLAHVTQHLGGAPGAVVLQALPGMAHVAADARTAARLLLARGDLEADMLTYYKFADALASMNWIARYDLRWNADEFSTQGDLDGALISAYVSDFMLPMRALTNAVTDLSAALDARVAAGAEGIAAGDGSADATVDTAYALVGHLHRLRLLMSYRPRITRMLQTRRGGQPFAMWTVYYAPYVSDIFEYRIPEAWRKAPSRMAYFMKAGLSWWGDIAVALGQLPCRLAHSDPEERRRRCGGGGTEGFAAGHPSAAGASSDDHDGAEEGSAWAPLLQALGRARNIGAHARALHRRATDASASGAEREGFTEDDGLGTDGVTGLFGPGGLFSSQTAGEGAGAGGRDTVEGASLGSALSAIVKFIKGMLELMGGLLRLVGMLFTDPFAAIVQGISLVLGTIIGVWLLITYIMLTVTGTVFVLLTVLSAVLSFGAAWWYTVFQVLLAVLLAIPFFVLWLIDLVTDNLATKLMRCEDLPDAWATVPNYANGNGHTRIGACFAPCPSRFAPAGCFCARRGAYMPDFCPQQQLGRAFVGAELRQPYLLSGKHQPNAVFASKSIADKIRALVQVYRDKTTWYQACFARFAPYGFTTRHVCSDVRRFARTAASTSGNQQQQRDLDDTVATLSKLCRECMCDFRAGDKDRAVERAAHEAAATPLCTRLYALSEARKDAAAPARGMTGPAVDLVRRISMAGILTLAVLSVFYAMIKASEVMVDEAVAPEAGEVVQLLKTAAAT